MSSPWVDWIPPPWLLSTLNYCSYANREATEAMCSTHIALEAWLCTSTHSGIKTPLVLSLHSTSLAALYPSISFTTIKEKGQQYQLQEPSCLVPTISSSSPYNSKPPSPLLESIMISTPYLTCERSIQLSGEKVLVLWWFKNHMFDNNTAHHNTLSFTIRVTIDHNENVPSLQYKCTHTTS